MSKTQLHKPSFHIVGDDVYLPSYSTIAPLIETLKQNDRDVDLSGLLQSEGKDWVATNYSAKLLQLGQVDGKQYAMPFTASLPMLHINQDLVTKAGADMNNLRPFGTA